MLIQITNMCYENCPHCMQCSNHLGEHMDEATFRNALKFGQFLGASVFIISGGEHTTHPLFFQFCQYLDRFIKQNKMKAAFTVTSNGTWFPQYTDEMKELAKLSNYAGMQVYTNPKWYHDAAFIIKHKDELNAIPKVEVDTTDIRSMQDLGRAKTSKAALEEVAANPHYMSCLNGHLLFSQTSPSRRLTGMDVRPGVMCKPCVDFNGNVHLSESHLCPSFGNVNDDYVLEIFNNLRTSQPCCKCALGKKFLKSKDIQIAVARNLLGFKE